MPSTIDSMRDRDDTVHASAFPTTAFEDLYIPKGMLKHPDFRILEDHDRSNLDDPSSNVACAYTPAHELHMIHKPIPTPGPGEVLVHVRATGICGSVVSATSSV